MAERIFIVEDERRIARFLQMELEHEGFVTATETSGARAYERIAQEDFDLVLLDVMLPGMDGVTVCRKVREFSQVPIIMLTAKDDVMDKVTGLDSGADDYVTKPFAVPELLARIRVALRKRELATESPAADEKLVIKDLVLYPKRYEAEVKGHNVEFSKREYDLLAYLMRHQRLVLKRDQILQDVWGYDYMGETNVVDVYVRYLRAKLEKFTEDKYIHTVRGVGYVLKV